MSGQYDQVHEETGTTANAQTFEQVWDFQQLWNWACAEAKQARMNPPHRLHSRDGDRSDWGKAREHTVIRGLPFTKGMARYLDHGLSHSMTEALQALKPVKGDRSSRARRQMWRVVNQIVVGGETSTEVVRKKVGLEPFAFRTVALNGLLSLKTVLRRDL